MTNGARSHNKKIPAPDSDSIKKKGSIKSMNPKATLR